MKLSSDQYVAGKGNKCPSCEGKNLEGNSVEIDGGTASQEVSCNDCSSEWLDLYELTGYGDLIEG